MVQLTITITTHLLKYTISHSYPEPTRQEWNCTNKKKQTFICLCKMLLFFFLYLNVLSGLKQKKK